MTMQTIKEFMEAEALELADRVWPKKPKPTLVVVPGGPRAWFALQTVLHGEAKVVEGLTALGYETFVPEMRRDRWNRKTCKWVRRTFRLFNRYVFAELPAATRQWGPVLDIPEIAFVLGMQGEPVPINPQEIARVMADQKAGKFDDLRGVDHRASTLKKWRIGAQVRAIEGPFHGFAGQVVNADARGSLNVLVTLFDRLTPITINPAWVEAA